jgi:hypothetical protein
MHLVTYIRVEKYHKYVTTFMFSLKLSKGFLRLQLLECFLSVKLVVSLFTNSAIWLLGKEKCLELKQI